MKRTKPTPHYSVVDFKNDHGNRAAYVLRIAAAKLCADDHPANTPHIVATVLNIATSLDKLLNPPY